MGGSQGCGVCNKDDGDSDDNDDFSDETLTGWERKLMVDANQKWGRAQAIEWMKEVNFFWVILSWLIVIGGWLVVDIKL